MKLGIIGLPYSGKTTIFHAVTLSDPTEGSSRAKGAIQIRTVRVPDARLDDLSRRFKPEKHTPATVEYLDLAREQVPEEKRGEASSSPLREADAFVHVLRAFDDPTAPHPHGRLDPIADWEETRTELVLRDLEPTTKRFEKLEKEIARGGPKVTQDDRREHEALGKIRASLEQGKPVSSVALSPDEKRILRGFAFLSGKPELVVLNVGEGREAAFPEAETRFGSCVRISGRIEAELAALPDEERETFAAEMGVKDLAARRLIRASYDLLGVGSFFTVGEDECRAWPVVKGENAVECSGKIHSDLARGFIRAEVCSYDDFCKAGSLAEARAKGTLRLEGKEYLVKDGDIMHVRFSV